MRVLTHDECVAWVAGRGRLHGVASAQWHTWPGPLEERGYKSFRRAYLADSGRKVYTARMLHALFEEGEVLVWLSDFVVWESSAHMPLLRRWREAFGERRSFEEAPGHLFTPGESDDAVSVLVMALQFYWDAVVVGASGERVVRLSHDEYFELWSSREEDLGALERDFQTE